MLSQYMLQVCITIYNFFNISYIFIFSACPDEQIRFGDYCYKDLPIEKQSIEKNTNDCEDQYGHLWYPHSTSEFAFIKSTFPVKESATLYHLGIHTLSSDGSFVLLNGEENPGIPFYTGS